jgi:hypothetical protein
VRSDIPDLTPTEKIMVKVMIAAIVDEMQTGKIDALVEHIDALRTLELIYPAGESAPAENIEGEGSMPGS